MPPRKATPGGMDSRSLRPARSAIRVVPKRSWVWKTSRAGCAPRSASPRTYPDQFDSTTTPHRSALLEHPRSGRREAEGVQTRRGSCLQDAEARPVRSQSSRWLGAKLSSVAQRRMAFTRCESCRRHLRVWNAELRASLPANTPVASNTAVASLDSDFRCPYCGTRQECRFSSSARVARIHWGL